MIIKKFDYNEFISKSKSLNCESVGTIGSTGATGIDVDIHNDNTNTILDHDKNKIVPKENEVTGSEGKKKINTALIISIIALGVVGVGAYLLYKKINVKEKERKRKRILLLTK